MSAANGGRPLQAEEVPVGGLRWPSLVALVAEAELPIVDLDRGDAIFWLVRDAEGEPVGCFGLELAGPEALLRSVVVRPGRRRGGLGAAIVGLAEATARALGVRRLVLLTETAGPFFERLDYRPMD